MGTALQSVSRLSERMGTTAVRDSMEVSADSPLLVNFIEKIFIPDHVLRKRTAGRTHYQALLKHILRPETVALLFSRYPEGSSSRLKSVPNWPYLDDLRLCDLRPEHVRQLVASAVARGYSPQTVKHIKNVIRTIILYASKAGMYVGDNPSAGIKLPRMVRKETRHLTIDQAKTVLRRLENPEREIALVTMTTGMSISEICALKWKDINMSLAAVYADGQLIPPQGILVKKPSRSLDNADFCAGEARVIVVSDSLIFTLKKLKRGCTSVDPDNFVVTMPDGKSRLGVSALANRLKPIGRELRLPWLTWRVLRRAHDALLSELRLQLTDELVENTR